MSDVGYPVQGIIDVFNVQGNYLEVPMVFDDGNDVPINLSTEFEEIRMEMKNDFDVNEPPFKVFELGSGLTISGESNNVLTFVLDEQFWLTQQNVFVYDITFKKSTGERYTFIKGTISNTLTASKI